MYKEAGVFEHRSHDRNDGIVDAVAQEPREQKRTSRMYRNSD